MEKEKEKVRIMKHEPTSVGRFATAINKSHPGFVALTFWNHKDEIVSSVVFSQRDWNTLNEAMNDTFASENGPQH